MKTKKWAISIGLAAGMIAGSIFFTPSVMKASEEVILASVDWVTSQLSPIKSDIASLKAKVEAQQKEIDRLKQQLANQPSTPTLPSTVYVAKNNVAIRSGASTNYKVIAYKNAGDSLKVIDSFTSSQGLWYRVELSSTLKGWVYSGDVSTSRINNNTQKTVSTTDRVDIRKGATTSYPVIATVERGTSLVFIQSFTNSQKEVWYNVQLSNGQRGWMPAKFGEVK
ncbi:hypothetical protein PG301_20960 [Parageobacillus sp. G301]|jgi:uncharacterized protein YgiM (DUF1202 family)|nr:hypothetical protein PG301_20960 [Parageobacillus sp. G301]